MCAFGSSKRTIMIIKKTKAVVPDARRVKLFVKPCLILGLFATFLAVFGSCMPKGWPYKSKLGPMKKQFATPLRIAVLSPVADYGEGAKKGFKHKKTRKNFICGGACAAIIPLFFYDHHEHDWKFKNFSRQLSIALTKDLRAVKVFDTVDYRPPSTDYDYIIRPVVVKARRRRGFINVLPVGLLNFATQILVGGLVGVPWIRTEFRIGVRFEIIAPPKKTPIARLLANAKQKNMLQLIFWIPRGSTKVDFHKLLGKLNRYAVYKVIPAIRADAIFDENSKASVAKRRLKRLFKYAEKYDPRLIEKKEHLGKKAKGKGLDESTVDYLLRLQQIRLRQKLERDGASAASELFLKADEKAVIKEYKTQKAKTLNLVATIAGAAAGAASSQIGNLASSGAINASVAKGAITQIATFNDIIQKGIDIELSRTYATPKKIEKKILMTGGVLDKWRASVLRQAGLGGSVHASKAMRSGLIKIAYNYGKALAHVKNYAAAIKAFDQTYQELYDSKKNSSKSKGRLIARKVALAGSTALTENEIPKIKEGVKKNDAESVPRKAVNRKKPKLKKTTHFCRKKNKGVRIHIRHVKEYETVTTLVKILNSRSSLSPVHIIKFGGMNAKLCVGRDLPLSVVAGALMDKRMPWRMGILSLQKKTIVVNIKGKRKKSLHRFKRQNRRRPRSLPKTRKRAGHKKVDEKKAREKRRVERRKKAGGCGRDAKGTTLVIRRVKRFFVAAELRKALKKKIRHKVSLTNYKRKNLTLCVQGIIGPRVASQLHSLGEEWNFKILSVTSYRVKSILRKYRRKQLNNKKKNKKTNNRISRRTNHKLGVSRSRVEVKQAENETGRLVTKGDTGSSQSTQKNRPKALDKNQNTEKNRGSKKSMGEKSRSGGTRNRRLVFEIEEKDKTKRNVSKDTNKSSRTNGKNTQFCRRNGIGIRVYIKNVRAKSLSMSLQSAIRTRKNVKKVIRLSFKKRSILLCVIGLPASQIAKILLSKGFPLPLKIIQYSPKQLFFTFFSRR